MNSRLLLALLLEVVVVCSVSCQSLVDNELDVTDATTISIEGLQTSTLKPTTRRPVKPGPKCYYCLNNCTEDWTSDVIKTCTADQICVRKMTSIVDKDGVPVLSRSSGCTYQCKVGFLVSDAVNMTTRCCESYKDRDCSIPEFTADALKPHISLPLPTLVLIATINFFVAYFF